MGCCGSSANVQDMDAGEKFFIKRCCQDALKSRPVDDGFSFLIGHYKNKLRKKFEETYQKIVNDDSELLSYAGWPNDVNGTKSIKQRLLLARNYAGELAFQRYAKQFKQNKKLDLEDDNEEKENQKIKVFIEKAVAHFWTDQVKERIQKLFDNDGHDDENDDDGGAADLKPSASRSSGRSGVYEKDKSAAAVAPKTTKSSSAATPAKHRHDDKPAVSQKQQAANSANKKNNNAAASNLKKPTASSSASSGPAPSFKLAPQSQCPRPTAPHDNPENCWVICDDCTYYWNEYKGVYYDPLSKKYFDSKVNKWSTHDPTMR